jgi:hypothetical protein
MPANSVTLLPYPPTCPLCRDRMRYVTLKVDRMYPASHRALFVCTCGWATEQVITAQAA